MECDGATIQENRGAQAEEMEALHYIYGEDCAVHSDERFCEIQVYQDDRKGSAVKLIVFFPDNYPSACPPFIEASASWLSDELRDKLLRGLSGVYSESSGEVVVFRWVEWMKEQAWLWMEANVEPAPSQQNLDIKSEDIVNTSQSNSSQSKPQDAEALEQNLEELDKVLGVIHGVPFTEKRSTFQAHLAPVRSADGVQTVMEALLRNRKIAAATHNIMAYRISLADKNVILQDYDDDGETAAGARLLHLLQIVEAEDVVVVVSRWFGGILLGPDRFKHINNAARGLLDACGFIRDGKRSSNTSSSSSSSSSRKAGKRH